MEVECELEETMQEGYEFEVWMEIRPATLP